MKWILISLFSASLSMAAADVTCWDGDCLNNGWTWSHSSGVTNDYGCYRDGCRKDGWIIKGLGRSTYTQCKSGGCFNEGWYEVNQENQNMLRNVVCRDSENESSGKSCLKNGWVTYSQNGQERVVSCHGSDCEKKGWLIQTNYQMIQVYCKKGGCFTSGWNEM